MAHWAHLPCSDALEWVLASNSQGYRSRWKTLSLRRKTSWVSTVQIWSLDPRQLCGSSVGEHRPYLLQVATLESRPWVVDEDARDLWASLVPQMVNNLPAMQETQVRSLGREDPLEKGMATHSSILAWRIPWKRSLAGYRWGLEESDMTEQLTLAHIGGLWGGTLGICICGRAMEEAGLGQGERGAASVPSQWSPRPILQEVLKLGWLFRVLPSRSKGQSGRFAPPFQFAEGSRSPGAGATQTEGFIAHSPAGSIRSLFVSVFLGLKEPWGSVEWTHMMVRPHCVCDPTEGTPSLGIPQHHKAAANKPVQPWPSQESLSFWSWSAHQFPLCPSSKAVCYTNTLEEIGTKAVTRCVETPWRTVSPPVLEAEAPTFQVIR